MNSKLTIALAVSVAVNVFAVAAGTALWVTREKVEERVAQASKPGRAPVWKVLDGISPAVRDQVKVKLRASAMQARPDFEEARAARYEAITLTQGNAFDAVAVAALLERSRASEMRGRARLEAGAVATLNGLGAKDRKALAPILARHKSHNDGPNKGSKSVKPPSP